MKSWTGIFLDLCSKQLPEADGYSKPDISKTELDWSKTCSDLREYYVWGPKFPFLDLKPDYCSSLATEVQRLCCKYKDLDNPIFIAVVVWVDSDCKFVNIFKFTEQQQKFLSTKLFTA
jgi:hypothetical protein